MCFMSDLSDLVLFIPLISILYADLEFQPEECFSPAARNLLSGLIKR